MEIPVEQIVDKLLTNHLISRKAVMVLGGLVAIVAASAQILQQPEITQQHLIVGITEIVGIVAMVVSGVFVQGNLDKIEKTNGTT